MQAEIKGLIELLNTELVEVVYGNQIAQSPKNPYAKFEFISGTRLGRPYKSSTYDGVDKPNVVTEHLQTQRQMAVDITWYTKTRSDLLEDIANGVTVVNKEAREFADEFIGALESSNALDYTKDNLFSILGYNEFDEIDNFLSDVWERRAMVELQINYVTLTSSDIPFISGYSDLAQTPATITGEYVNPDGSDL
jgi:hypothetical protein